MGRWSHRVQQQQSCPASSFRRLGCLSEARRAISRPPRKGHAAAGNFRFIETRSGADARRDRVGLLVGLWRATGERPWHTGLESRRIAYRVPASRVWPVTLRPQKAARWAAGLHSWEPRCGIANADCGCSRERSAASVAAGGLLSDGRCGCGPADVLGQACAIGWTSSRMAGKVPDGFPPNEPGAVQGWCCMIARVAPLMQPPRAVTRDR